MILKGIVASKGNTAKIKGVCYLSEYFDTLPKKNICDTILVCIKTDFSNISLLPKFKAIVTEYGGILSHAAIVSRELKIPCIVGVKDITKIVKDGQLIELNLNTGEIKLL